MRWLWIACFVAASLCSAWSQEDEDDEDSKIEIESGPEPSDEPEGSESSGGRALADGAIAARAEDAKVEWRTLTDKKKLYRLSVPTDWRIQESSSANDQVEFRAWVPGAAHHCLVIVRERPDPPPPASLMQRVFADTVKRQPQDKVQSFAEPFPMLRVTRKGATTLWGFFRLGGRSIEIGLDSAVEDHDAIKADFLAVAERLRSAQPALPTIPKSYKTFKKGRFRIAVHPAVTTSLKPLLRAIADQDKKFAKFHGKVPRSAVSPVIFVHSTHRAGAGVYSNLSKATDHAIYDMNGSRVFTLPIPGKKRSAVSDFSGGFANFNFIERYRVLDPVWARAGESDLATARELMGLKLPALPANYTQWHDKTRLGSLEDLNEEYRKRDVQAFRQEAFYYVLFFRCGPSKYRKAYKAFLDDLRKCTDPLEARRRHLDKLGLAKIREAAIAFKSSKIKYVRPR